MAIDLKGGEMRDEERSKKQLIEELNRLRHSVTGLDRARDERKGEKKRVDLLSSGMEFSPESVFIVDMAGVITYANEATEKMIRVPVHDLIGKNFSGLFLNSREAKDILRNVIEKGYDQVEAKMVDDDDRRFWGLSTHFLVADEEKHPLEIISIVRDINKQKRAEEALRESEARYRLITKNMSDVISCVDMDLRSTYMSPSVKRLLGYDVEESMSRTLQESLTPASYEAVEKAMEKEMSITHEGVHNNSELRIKELEFYRKDGLTVWCEATISFRRDIDGKPVEMITVLRDIRERKKAEQALQESERKYRALIDQSYDAIYIYQNNKFHFVNRRACEIVGYNEGELYQMTIWDLIHPSDRDRIEKVVQSWQGGEGMPNTYEARVMTKDGETRYAEFALTVIPYKYGQAILGSARDITERKKTEKELDQYRAELEQSLDELRIVNEKLQDMDKVKDDFLSTVSHELRTPLTSIKSFAEILLNYEDDREIQREFLNIINDESDRLTRLINDFLDLSKIESGRMHWQTTKIALSEVIESAISSAEALFKQLGLKTEIELEPDLPLVWGDKDRFVQVVTNLISNAAKFTPEGGKIKVRVKHVEWDGDDALGGVQASVIDNGRGILPEDQKYIFEKFTQVGDTVSERALGTGLGLSICREIVEHYDGKIWVESIVGIGSTFSFVLPVVQESEIEGPKVDLKEGEEAEQVSSESGNTILVVDDDANVRRFLSHELTRKGYHVIEASDGEEAIDKVKKFLPDLITLDVMMPGISGFEVTSNLKKDPDTMSIPILIISVLDVKEESLKRGADAYVPKSASSEVILERISNLLLSPQGTILVVDDDKSLVKSITYELEQRGFSTAVAHDGEEALDVVNNNPPDLIILDMLMPKMDGHEVIRELKSKSNTSGIPVIVLTGLELDEERVKNFPSGASGFFTKAGGLSQLLESTARILSGK